MFIYPLFSLSAFIKTESTLQAVTGSKEQYLCKFGYSSIACKIEAHEVIMFRGLACDR